MEFNEKIDHWKKLFKTKREEADQFYYSSMFKDVIERFIQKAKNLDRYRFLITLLGFSPQPVILFIRAMKPEKVLFIHSEETESYLNVIQQWADLQLVQVVRHQVNSSDPTDVYKAIKEFVGARNPREILLDLTGGKKAMVGGAAMAGNLLGIDTGYVDYSGYLPDLRQPEPGSEYPNILKNPFYVFGDIDLEKAKDAFDHYNFQRCLNILNDLEIRVEDVWGIRKLKALTGIYQAWDAFEFLQARNLLMEFMEKYKDDRRFISLEEVRKSVDILNILSDKEHPEYQTSMCLNYYFASERLAERGRYDIAVFLMYRTIEMVLSEALREVGIDPSNPRYPDWLTLAQYHEKTKEIFGKDHYEKGLPHKVGLMDSAIMLAIRQDRLVADLNLKELRGIIDLRNSSHFTHGYRSLNHDDFKKIRRMGRKLLEKYLSLKGKELVRDYETSFHFPKI